MSLASIEKVALADLKGFEHTFVHWVTGAYIAVEKDLPALDKLADRTFPLHHLRLADWSCRRGPAAAAAAGPVMNEIKAALDTASGLITDFGATPTVQGILTTVQSKIGSIEQVAGIKSATAQNAVSKALASAQAFTAAVSGAIAAATPAPEPEPEPEPSPLTVTEAAPTA